MKFLRWANYFIMVCVALFNFISFIIDHYIWLITDMPYPAGAPMGLMLAIVAFAARNAAFTQRIKTVIKEPRCFCTHLAQQENDPHRITTIY